MVLSETELEMLKYKPKAVEFNSAAFCAVEGKGDVDAFGSKPFDNRHLYAYNHPMPRRARLDAPDALHGKRWPAWAVLIDHYGISHSRNSKKGKETHMYLVRLMVVAVAVLFFGGMAHAADLGGLGEKAGKKLSQKASDTTMDKFTKRLKKAQNEKGPIRFKKGKAAVDPACDSTMKYIAKILKESPGFHVQVDGHTDNVGKPESNRKLSQERAEAVVKYLVAKKGVDAKRLSAKGFGDTQPIADNKTEKGRAKNRRVDFTVTKM